MKTIAVHPNPLRDKDFKVTKTLIKTLRGFGAKVLLNSSLSNALKDVSKFAKFTDEDSFYKNSDFLITLGGDGTILGVAEKAAENSLPILGINMGKVGFMAELEVKQIDKIECIFTGGYTVEERMMLEVNINSGNAIYALNDVYFAAQTGFSAVEFDLFASEKFVSHYRADGLIFSTSTGSTAYSLSAGGSIIDPKIDCIAVIPVCSYLLNNARQMVFSPDTILTVKNINSGETGVCLSNDGRQKIIVNPEDIVTIKKSSLKTKLINIKNDTFFTTFFSKF